MSNSKLEVLDPPKEASVEIVEFIDKGAISMKSNKKIRYIVLFIIISLILNNTITPAFAFRQEDEEYVKGTAQKLFNQVSPEPVALATTENIPYSTTIQKTLQRIDAQTLAWLSEVFTQSSSDQKKLEDDFFSYYQSITPSEAKDIDRIYNMRKSMLFAKYLGIDFLNEENDVSVKEISILGNLIYEIYKKDTPKYIFPIKEDTPLSLAIKRDLIPDGAYKNTELDSLVSSSFATTVLLKAMYSPEDIRKDLTYIQKNMVATKDGEYTKIKVTLNNTTVTYPSRGNKFDDMLNIYISLKDIDHIFQTASSTKKLSKRDMTNITINSVQDFVFPKLNLTEFAEKMDGLYSPKEITSLYLKLKYQQYIDFAGVCILGDTYPVKEMP